MTLNSIIQQRRRELGLTQEQVAECLGVSTPAVSKWEKGLTCPDITLLPQLARLLKTDLNTLFCFQEKMSKQEISSFCRDITQAGQTHGIAAAFDLAIKKLQEYPHQEELLQCIALNLDGLLTSSAPELEEKAQFEEKITLWYRHLSASSDSRIRNCANYMLASRYIRQRDFDSAQETLDKMPEYHDVIRDVADKTLLQVTLFQNQGNHDQAVFQLETALLTAVNRVQIILNKLIDVHLSAGNDQAAQTVADKFRTFIELFELWRYSALAGHFQVASAHKNAEQIVPLIRDMLDALEEPWDPKQTMLFGHVAGNRSDALCSQIRASLLIELARDPEFSFLKDDSDFLNLLTIYQK